MKEIDTAARAFYEPTKSNVPFLLIILLDEKTKSFGTNFAASLFESQKVKFCAALLKDVVNSRNPETGPYVADVSNISSKMAQEFKKDEFKNEVMRKLQRPLSMMNKRETLGKPSNYRTRLITMRSKPDYVEFVLL